MLFSENKAMLIAFPNGLSMSKVRDSAPGISPTASFNKLVISDVPMLLSSDGINNTFR